MTKSFLHGLRGDLVEDHPLQGRTVQLSRLHQMPGDGLALAVGVGGQEDSAGASGRILDVLHHLALLFWHEVVRLESVSDIDAQGGLR
jgi:hypothetical protein